jgi:hypothetical protein
MQLTPIIPLKINSSIVTDNNTDRILKKLGFEADSFTDSLSNTEIVNAYMNISVPLAAKTQGGIKSLFVYFASIIEGYQSIHLPYSSTTIDISYETTIEYITGHVQDTGTYSNTITDKDERGPVGNVIYHRYRKIIHQHAENEYTQITIYNFATWVTVEGKTKYRIDGRDDVRMVATTGMLDVLSYKEWVEAYEESLNLFTYSKKTVHFEWYESRAFANFITAIGIIATVFSLGTLWEIGVAAAATAATITEAIVAVTLAVGEQLLITVAVGAIAVAAVDALLNSLGVGGAIAALVITAVVLSIAMPGAGAFLAEQWLPLANTVVDRVDKFEAHKAAEISKLDEKEAKEYEEKTEELLEQIEALTPNGINFDMNFATTQLKDERSADWLRRVKGGDMYDYRQLYILKVLYKDVREFMYSYGIIPNKN